MATGKPTSRSFAPPPACGTSCSRRPTTRPVSGTRGAAARTSPCPPAISMVTDRTTSRSIDRPLVDPEIVDRLHDQHDHLLLGRQHRYSAAPTSMIETRL